MAAIVTRRLLTFNCVSSSHNDIILHYRFRSALVNTFTNFQFILFSSFTQTCNSHLLVSLGGNLPITIERTENVVVVVVGVAVVVELINL